MRCWFFGSGNEKGQQNRLMEVKMIANLDTVAPDVAAVAATTAAAAEEEEKSPVTDEDKTRAAFPSFVSFAEDLQQKVPNHTFMLALEELKNVTEAADERSLWDYFTKHYLHDLKAIQGFMNAHQIITASITDFLSYANFLKKWYNSPENGRTTAGTAQSQFFVLLALFLLITHTCVFMRLQMMWIKRS
jgi:hypothetical protein